MKRLFLCLLIALFPSLWWAGSAAAIVTGSAEWNWAEYRRDVDGGEEMDLSHFYQNYTLFYRDRRLIQGGRAGRWNLGLGYEWTALDTSFNDGDVSIDTGKILYEGDFSFTPAGLPFSINVFSRDLSRANPTSLTTTPGNIIDPDIYVDIKDGQRVTTGITLLAGGPQANLFGNYREMLSAFPRLLVDYQETVVRDDKASDPKHYRERDLAFVSLNRKDNWFHYRVFEHTDYKQPENDYLERTWLLGTIDHLERRQWVNLTNWLSISVDGSLTRNKEWSRRNLGEEETYRFNFFSSARRRAWSFDNFLSFYRTTNDAGGLEKSFEFPVLASGEWDPLNRWKMYFIGDRWEQDDRVFAGSQFNRSEDSAYVKYQIESKRYAGRILTPEVEADWFRSSRPYEGKATRVGVELRSDNRLERAKDWLAACSAAWFDNTLGDSAYTELTAKVAASNRLSKTLEIGGSQELALGFGDYSKNITRRLVPVITEGFQDGSDRTRTLSGTSWRSTTNAYLQLTPPGRWRNRFSAYYDHIHTVTDRHQLRLQHDATYMKAPWRVTAVTILAEGDELNYRWDADELVGLETVTGVPETIFSHETDVSYTPNRFWDTKAKVRALWGEGVLGDAWLLTLHQKAAYHLYEASGVPRRWFSLEENFEYQRIWGDDSLWFAGMDLAAVYHMTRYLSLNTEIGVRHYGLTSQNEFEFEVSAVASFRKLQANVSYAYGRRDEGTFLPGVREQRWEVGLKKYF